MIQTSQGWAVAESFREYSEYGEFPCGPTQHLVEFGEIK